MTYSVEIEIAPTIKMTFEGDTIDEFEEDLRAGCLFAERCKFNQTKMMKDEAAFMSIKNAAEEIRKSFGAAGIYLFNTPVCDTAKKFYDFDARVVRTKSDDPAAKTKEVEHKAPPTAKKSKSEEGTVHLSPDMTTEELTEAIGKGGMKTIDLDDVDSLKKLLAAAKEKAAK